MASVRPGADRERPGDLFPMLEMFIGGGAIAGVTAALVAGDLAGRAPVGVVGQGALGAGLGAIVGLFVGLSRGVWRSEEGLHSPEPAVAPDRLWDAWLDSGRDLEPGRSGPDDIAADPDNAPVPNPVSPAYPAERARVRPRVISPLTGEAVPLDDEIGQLIEGGRYQFVGLAGGPGSGKTTALRHLAAVLPPWALARVRLVDVWLEPDLSTASKDPDGQLVISTGLARPSGTRQVIYTLSSWRQDDLIEYLLSAHWDRCAAVMARLKAPADPGFVKGIPELWTVVLDRMAGDESIVDTRAALRRELADWFEGNPRVRAVAEDFCLTGVLQKSDPVVSAPLSLLANDMLHRVELAPELLRLIRHRPVALLLAADRIKDIAERNHVDSAFDGRFPRDLVEEAAAAIAGNTLALDHLREWLKQGEQSSAHPMAASLLHAAVPGWRPADESRPRLSGAYLARASWRGLNLARVDLDGADLKEADLCAANLEKARARQARFQRADFRGAVLDSWIAFGADLSGADLRSIRAVSANFQGANLAGARLIEADLWRANLQDANIESADFTGANLACACLKGLRLRLGRFDLARFGGADLRECDMEEMMLTVPDFQGADLRAALMTGSRLYEANFAGANLRSARLAEIDWPGADLHNADLRWASFHLGSSRNGLVGSPIACEGSRTGFYTDDYADHDIKPAEEIRKANLRGADLRGAKVEGVDFYLVDLRGAKYTRSQAEHFRRCKAILDDRVG